MDKDSNKLPYNPADYGVKPSTFDGTEKSSEELMKNLQRGMFVDAALGGAYIGKSFEELLANIERWKKNYVYIDRYPGKDAIQSDDEKRNLAKKYMHDIIKQTGSTIYTNHFLAHQKELEQLLSDVKKHLFSSTVKSVNNTPFYDKKGSLQDEKAVNTIFQSFVDVFENICEKAYYEADIAKRLHRSQLHSLLYDKGININHMNSSLLMVHELVQEHGDVIVRRNTRDAMKWHCINYKIIEDTDHARIKEYIDLYHKIVMFY